MKRRPIAFISGCFDGLHKGHRFILTEMYRLSDCGTEIVVAINSDAYLARKGPGRPLFTLTQRMAALIDSGLVDRVIPIEDSPLEVIKQLKPDYIVVGRQDYLPEEVVGFKECPEWGGQVIIISPDMGVTSTQLVQAKLAK